MSARNRFSCMADADEPHVFNRKVLKMVAKELHISFLDLKACLEKYHLDLDWIRVEALGRDDEVSMEYRKDCTVCPSCRSYVIEEFPFECGDCGMEAKGCYNCTHFDWQLPCKCPSEPSSDEGKKKEK